MKRTRVKICGLTREADVDAAVDAGADAIGFVLYPASPRYVPLQRAVELAHRLPAFVSPVVLTVNADGPTLGAIEQEMPLAVWQFHGDETPQACRAATRDGRRPYIRAARIPLGETAPAFDLVEFATQHRDAQAILLDAHLEGYGGGGKAFNWSLLPPSVNAHLVLSGGLTPANVIDGITAVRGRGLSLAVDVSSGVESAKGIKDATRIRAFIAAVREADALNAPHNS